jgi:hypothetical protein
MKLVASIHQNVLLNVQQAQKKQKKTYATRKGKSTFEGFESRKMMVMIKKPIKRKALASSWEGPSRFMGYANGNRDIEFDEYNRICIIRDVDEHQWE